MRESKFRAWEKNLKEIIPVHSINFINKMINTDSAWRFFDEIELMQFTGLYDKNGKEIYEGDIVEYKDYSGGAYIFGKQPLARDVVKWNKETGGYKVRGTGYSFPTGKCEVIGNIYENPELLEN